MTKIHTLFFVRTFAVVTMKIYMNKTTIFSLTITLWGKPHPRPLSQREGSNKREH